MIVEFNSKENESFFHYCQYTGNEKELDKLGKMIGNCSFNLQGDHVSLKYITTKIPENVATFQASIRTGDYAPTFQKHNGVFKCPFEPDDADDDDCSELFDQYFFACQINNYFST